MKKTILLTFDYELFLSKSGKLNETLIIPTDKLLTKLKELKINATFFIDVFYYYRLTESPLYNEDKQLVRKQIQRMVSEGHDVQLHLHPHWMSAKYNEGEWYFDQPFKYRLQQHTNEEIRFFFKTGIILLEEICKPISPNYKVTAFRAGGLCIEPFDEIKKNMEEFGLNIDSSVAPGLKRKGIYWVYDFSNIPQKEYYHYSSTPYNHTENKGRFMEIPVNTYYTTVLVKIKKIFRRILEPENDFNPNGIAVVDMGNLEKIQKRTFFQKFQKDIRILSLDYTENLDVLSEIKNNNNEVFTILAHPKLQSSQSLVQLEKLYKQRYTFKTLSEFYSNIILRDDNNKKRNLFLITGEYPFGNWENALETEIYSLAESFKTVYIICSPSLIKSRRSIPKNVFIVQYQNSLYNKLFNFTKAISSRFLFQELKFIFNNYSFKEYFKLTKIAIGTLKNSFNFYSFLIQLIEREKIGDNLSFYSYWASDKSVGLSIFKHKHKNFKAITRAHSWDVYFERHPENYLPFRLMINNILDKVAYISEDSRRYTLSKIKMEINPKTQVDYLGVKEIKRTNNNVREEYFNIFSCSAIIPLKRINLIIDALKLIPSTVKIKWIHAGAGVYDEGRDNNLIEIKKYADEILRNKTNINYQFTGYVKNEDLDELYNNNNFNVFMNVSSIEGVPISIMEAMSNKIPIIATNVGGVSECVIDKYNGCLLSDNPTPQEIADAIQWLLSLNNVEYDKLSNNSHSLWAEKFNAEKNYSEFISFLNPA